jgi:hypothetical protein
MTCAVIGPGPLDRAQELTLSAAPTPNIIIPGNRARTTPRPDIPMPGVKSG